MDIFIDSANISDIQQAAKWGWVDGVTTNPSLLAQQGYSLKAAAEMICAIIDGPVSLECIQTDADAMYAEGLALAALHPNIVVKVPLTLDGLMCTKRLHQAGVKTNVTLCFSAAQALLAAKAGATYVSPFIGRLDDIGQSGLQLIKDIVAIYKHYDFKTKILAASIRLPRQVIDVAREGAHVVTVPYKILSQLATHPLTDSGLQQFLSDWQKSGR